MVGRSHCLRASGQRNITPPDTSPGPADFTAKGYRRQLFCAEAKSINACGETLSFSPLTNVIWSERWRDATRRIESIEAILSSDGAVVFRGGHYDRWDLEVRGGTLGCARIFTVLEEHGAGKQLLRVRSWPRFSLFSLSLILAFATMAVLAVYGHALGAAAILGAIAELFILRTFYECAAA